MLQIPTDASKESLHALGLEALNRYYGYSTFRPGQWEVMESVLRGRDTVVLMPTGGGKSLCFQIPALMAEGCCIVVSPLIALMNDQVTALRANGLPAAAINSMQYEPDNISTYEQAARGEVKLLYISPERLLADLERIKNYIKVSFIAVDEAHCISQWGHDFRPVYTSLSQLKEKWSEVPVMALTATADRLTREDIAGALALKEPYMHIGSFDRPNLSLSVIQGAQLSDRIRTIEGLIEKYSLDCGIVYCISRKKTEQMAERLAEAGYRVGCYHAGMSSADRERVQQEFVTGKLQAICATIAFGMGIDKSNIRWVVHNNIPGNIESYYQEIGRAGRDGIPAETILFYSYGDIITRRSFVEESVQREINESKLDFMQRYAEASVCRRRILLSYFSEEMSHDCGNCDNCRNPRPKIDGTVLAQKALSAIIRTKNSEGIGVIVEILRGMSRQYIIEKGYDKLRTFGVGNDLPVPVWHAYILQMIQLGLIEVAYEDHFHLRPTALGMRVVKGEERVELAKYVSPVYRSDTRKGGRATSHQPPAPVLTTEEKITVALKELRGRMAAERNLADYMVLSDASISQIAERKPETIEELLDIEGINLVKLNSYHKEFLTTIRGAMGMKRTLPKGSSEIVTWLMFRNGMEVEDIMSIRNLQLTTVLGHLVKCFEDGKEVDVARIISPTLFEKVNKLLEPLDAIQSSDNEAYAEARVKLVSELEDVYGINPVDYRKALSWRRHVEVVNGTYQPIVKTIDDSESILPVDEHKREGNGD